MADVWDSFLGLSMALQRSLASSVYAQPVAGGQGDWRELMEQERQALVAMMPPGQLDGIPHHLIPAALPADPDAYTAPEEAPAPPAPVAQDAWDAGDEDELALAIRASLGEAVSPLAALRETQDLAYLQSLQEDARKAQQRQRDMEEAALADEDAAVQDALRASQLEHTQRELADLRDSLVPEAPVGAEDACVLAIMLADGQRVVRRLHSTNTIGDIRDFVRVLQLDLGAEAVPDQFTVAMDFPRRHFANNAQTLREAGMFPRAAVRILREGGE